MEDTNKVIGFLEAKNYFRIDAERYIERIQKLYDMIRDYEKISDEEFYERLKKLELSSYLTKEDYCHIMGMINKKEYCDPVTIKTDMCSSVAYEDDDGAEIIEQIGINFEIIYVDGTVNFYHVYTNREIKRLLATKKIVILQTIEGPYNFENKLCPPYEEIYASSRELFDSKKGKYHKAMLKYVRKEITKEKLHELFNRLLNQLKEEVKMMEEASKEFEDKGFQMKIGALEK